MSEYTSSFKMDEIPTTRQQEIDFDRAMSPNLLPDIPPCNNQLYPIGAVIQEKNYPYTANLLDLDQLYSQENFTNLEHYDSHKILMIVILIQIILLFVILMKGC
jgi:hypothetical protein